MIERPRGGPGGAGWGARALVTTGVGLVMLLPVGSAQDVDPSTVSSNQDELSWTSKEVRFRVLAIVHGDLDAVRSGELPAGDLIRVDRGSRDGVRIGDRVEFTPKGGIILFGHVVQVDERSSLVKQQGSGGQELLEPGVAGSVQVELQAQGSSGDPKAGTEGAETGEPGLPSARIDDRPEWLRLRESWTSDLPLLANVQPEMPKQRPVAWGGRMYFQTGLASAFSSDRGDAALRSGVDLWSSNPFGWGGEVEFDSEYDFRALWVPEEDGDGNDRSRLRLDRLSYTLGGARYDSETHRFGRFLQAIPELGVLDGYEWRQRFDTGDTVGASVGYLTATDFNASTGHNLATSVFYKWVADEREVLSASGAFSKSFHNGERDRDLFAFRGDYLPKADLRGIRPWDLHLSMLLDRYSGEDAQDDGLALTHFSLETRKEERGSFGATDDLRIHFRHQETPEALYFELEPLTLAGLVRDREDRLGFSTSQWLQPDRRAHGFAGIWSAGGLEEDTGGDLELGLELLGMEGYGPGAGDGVADMTMFVSHGRYNTTTGFHCSYGRRWEGVGWELLYEFALSDQDGFLDSTDDIYQHRLRLTADVATVAGWSVAGHGDLLSHGDDGSLSVGVYCGRSF